MDMSIFRRKVYKKRIIDDMVETYLDTFGAVCVEGPKWCGKTWTSYFHSKSYLMIGDPQNNFSNKQLAIVDPTTALNGDNPRLIDEWQEVPSLWDAVRFAVDKESNKGQFILTGSSTPKLKGFLHTGAGRIGVLRMRPMSLYESGDSSGLISLKDICEGTVKDSLTGSIELIKLANVIIRGGWPGNLDLPINNAQIVVDSYINTFLENELPRIDDIKYDINKVRLLLKSLARNESTTVSMNTIQKDISESDGEMIDTNTLSRYFSILERVFLLDNQPAFSTNIRSSVRLKQQEKRHFCDPSIACSLLNLNVDRMMNDLNTFGFMFESLVERDLRIYAESFGAKLFHYQDYHNKEIDAVIELKNGDWCAFEIKLGANMIDAAAKNLISINESIRKDGGKTAKTLCVICGLTNAAYRRPDGVYVVPITALKN